MKFKIFLLSVFACAVVLTNCRKDVEKTPVTGKSFTVNATSKTRWIYFSFEKNDTVQIADPANSTDWDIAYQRYMVIANCGKSGKGLSGAYDTKKIGQAGFDSIKAVPTAATFVVDDSVTVYGYNPANPAVPTEKKYILNSVLYSWYKLVESATGTTITPQNQIFVVKTAKGKYVKLWIRRYYNDANTPAYIYFDYAYQSDGSKDF